MRQLPAPPAFDRSVAALAYAFPLDRMIPRLKYHAQLAIAPAPGQCLANADAAPPRPDRLIAIPLHSGARHAPQTRLKHDARRNVRGAFGCRADVCGLHLALVDAVMTTGTSLDEWRRC